MLTQIEIKRLGEILRDQSVPLKARNRAIFTLRSTAGTDMSLAGIKEIYSAFKDESALLKHECAYCMGQMVSSEAIHLLVEVLHDTEQEVIVRHEAGEALGAIGDPVAIQDLSKYTEDPCKPLSETCNIAIERINFYQKLTRENIKFEDANPYFSVDPAPPCSEGDCEKWRNALVDASTPLFHRYRCLFSLRNAGTDESVLAVCEGFKNESILFRHEVAYVLGQLQNRISIPALKSRLTDLTEDYMVRHESAEALGAIADAECRELLTAFLNDQDRCVRESCEVALDICDYETSGESIT